MEERGGSALPRERGGVNKYQNRPGGEKRISEGKTGCKEVQGFQANGLSAKGKKNGKKTGKGALFPRTKRRCLKRPTAGGRVLLLKS